jgi:NAD(P)-dependent dehydrogenase (short-subunit alcohol dehydrogenase family)
MAADHVLVVGGTKGLGRIVAERFSRTGAVVTVVSRQAPESSPRPAFSHIAADLQSPDCAGDIVSRALEVAGPIRYLLFCQRYRGTGDPWHGELQVSLTATKAIIEGFADHFCPNGDRAIGVVSSVYAEFVGGSQPLGYHVAKAGLNQMVRYFGWTLGHKGIRINAIMPLTYMKPESRDFYLANQKLLDVYKRFVPLERLGDVEDSANLLEFLCSTKAGFINGQCIFVDGGTSVIWPEELARSFSEI